MMSLQVVQDEFALRWCAGWATAVSRFGQQGRRADTDRVLGD
jgi:hypothetical protein